MLAYMLWRESRLELAGASFSALKAGQEAVMGNVLGFVLIKSNLP